MALPLQPDLRPIPPWLGRVFAALALALAVLVLGALSGARRRPPEMLLTDGHPYAYVRALERRFDLARQRIWVTMFVVRCEGDPATAPADDPVAILLRGLAAAAARGVDVRVALDYGRDHVTREPEAKHAVAAAWLAARGVRVVLDELDRTTHAKVAMIDGRWIALGSHNWTRSALVLNREVSLLLEDAALAATLERELFARIPGWDP